MLIVDDHPVVREGIRSLLQRCNDFEVVAEAADGAEAIDLWEAQRPDVTLLDLRMPRADGIQVTERIVARNANARVVILTSFVGDHDVARAIAAGACGYLSKDAEPKELFASVRAAHAGHRYLASTAADSLASARREEPLTRRELKTLGALALAFTNQEIAESLGISCETVRSHLKRIYAKLGVSGRAEALLVAMRRGLVQDWSESVRPSGLPKSGRMVCVVGLMLVLWTPTHQHWTTKCRPACRSEAHQLLRSPG